ncbi:MAG: hypothetical protein Ct9H300mP27_11010 [Chloroflexota bacterium]|nr:MAG: hypothetical protein Ct9H300mP27_11010 [Chloroflexota bacterium]
MCTQNASWWRDLLTFNNKQILETSVVSVTYVIGDITFERTIGVERRYIPFNIRDRAY